MNDGACRPHLLTRLAIENWRERRRTTRSLPRASPELKAQTAFATRTERMNEAIFPATYWPRGRDARRDRAVPRSALVVSRVFGEHRREVVLHVDAVGGGDPGDVDAEDAPQFAQDRHEIVRFNPSVADHARG